LWGEYRRSKTGDGIRKDGKMERWKEGKMERRKDGMVENWKNGKMRG